MASDSEFDRIFGTQPQPPEISPSLPTRAQIKKSRRRPRRSWGKQIFAGVSVLVLGFLGTGGWLFWAEYGDRVIEYFAPEEIPDFVGEGSQPAVEIVVEPGEIGETIARTLAEEGVTASFEAVYEILLQDTSITFLPGTYRLLTGMSGDSAIVALLDPANRVQNEILIREGVNLQQALDEIAAQTSIPVDELSIAASDPSLYGVDPPNGSLEGYLFPATYRFEPGASAEDIISRMVEEMKEKLVELDVVEERWHKTLTLASIIQREARFEEDFYKVSAVFSNRLDISMPLQSDATISYWTGDYEGAGTSDSDRSDQNNPFNTYVFPGLTPGPISLPGELAINAAMNPADGNWLYFVSVDLRTGETVFSEEYRDHLRAVEVWLAWCRESDENGEYC